jgi:hypothetical protein
MWAYFVFLAVMTLLWFSHVVHGLLSEKKAADWRTHVNLG